MDEGGVDATPWKFLLSQRGYWIGGMGETKGRANAKGWANAKGRAKGREVVQLWAARKVFGVYNLICDDSVLGRRTHFA